MSIWSQLWARSNGFPEKLFAYFSEACWGYKSNRWSIGSVWGATPTKNGLLGQRRFWERQEMCGRSSYTFHFYFSLPKNGLFRGCILSSACPYKFELPLSFNRMSPQAQISVCLGLLHKISLNNKTVPFTKMHCIKANSS